MTSENYFSWRDEVQLAFHQVSDSTDITRLIEQQTIRLGFDFYALYIRHPVPFTRPKIFIYSSYPEKWLCDYQQQNFAAIDPVIKNCQIPGKILLWDASLNRSGRRVFEAAKEYGINSGFSACTMAKNRAIGILSMASGEAFEKMKLTPDKQLKLQYLSVLIMDALQRVKDISMAMMKMELSQRELEILKWTAEGKTSAEISLILSISENTVNFHQKNMQKRFNAPNKTQVAAYAAAIGLL
ncbi:LuxR family transcriptional regulator [Erwinia typographi]|uniref:LuxR family transcriptional regulator n=1 Tax=Erwinia typographi TaxID=371042 RepID=A0A0A3Z9C7_9GAMM|nr:transcriptional regulator SdiA [Erwinia typographi]KGT94246.1 LuxR family transcriptional regulator [Erwinia typographi]